MASNLISERLYFHSRFINASNNFRVAPARRLSGARKDLLLTEPAAMTGVEIVIEERIPREEPA